MPNPSSYFDVLSITSKLSNSMQKVSIAEIHLFSYLSCLLWLYKKQPVAFWGYPFAATPQGHPYSADLDESIKYLLRNGTVAISDDKHIIVTPSGETEFSELLKMTMFTEREPYLEGACSCVLAMPIGMIRNGIMNEPEINNSIALAQKRMLLTTDGVDMLYEQFDVLSKAIGVAVDDLMIPSVVWVTYLSGIQN
ncbi:hypothetical protein KI809_07380 [Geobacter pelophilus]|uniref:Uncharacterized protein n=1 Tax=Geoanaerobacter pelophilus TaxID=60036 RepID=A0AAW4LAA8_9BACT|nr:hypothetical protein [Geoanaerobacter pelophilus]MBT0664121.1 hypothetical protein [Geoanaerobacter pelophilus]